MPEEAHRRPLEMNGLASSLAEIEAVKGPTGDGVQYRRPPALRAD
ncbi:hypothetical protein [Rhizobium sp. CIAT894]|nr:hypothetical protein [Rhizobium sp. CIAT894]